MLSPWQIYQLVRPGVRRYRLPSWFWREMSFSIAIGGTRDTGDDARRVLTPLPIQPHVQGLDYIPADGPCVLVANHYQRFGLWIGFTGAVLARAMQERRGDRQWPRYAVIGDLRLNGRLVPGTAWLFARVAHAWNLVPLPDGQRALGARAAAMRRLLTLAVPPPRGSGQPIGIFPEGSRGSTAGLREALPGTGALMLLLSRADVPILPAAVWESGARLHARFGPTFSLTPPDGLSADARDAWARTQTMRHVAALLPTRLRGAYEGPFPERLT